MPSNLELEINQRLWERDFSRYAADCMRIKNTHGQIVPFILNRYQKQVDAVIERQQREGKPVRVIVLKRRKAGTSTHAEGGDIIAAGLVVRIP